MRGQWSDDQGKQKNEYANPPSPRLCMSRDDNKQVLSRVARMLELAEVDLSHFRTVTRTPEGRPRPVYPSTALQVERNYSVRKHEDR